MLTTKNSHVKGLKQAQVKEMILFAMTYLPQLDQTTLNQFMQLIDDEDIYGYISARELANKMQLILKHIPNACHHSLETLAELLDVQLQNPKATAKLLQLGVFAGEMGGKKYAHSKVH